MSFCHRYYTNLMLMLLLLYCQCKFTLKVPTCTVMYLNAKTMLKSLNFISVWNTVANDCALLVIQSTEI